MIGSIGSVGRMGLIGSASSNKGGGAPAPATELRRESNGTVTVLSLADPYTPVLTRQPNGSVDVGAA